MLSMVMTSSRGDNDNNSTLQPCAHSSVSIDELLLVVNRILQWDSQRLGLPGGDGAVVIDSCFYHFQRLVVTTAFISGV